MLSLLGSLLLHFFESCDVGWVILATLVIVGYLLRHVYLLRYVVLLELVEQGERLWFVRVQVPHDPQRCVELDASHLLVKHVFVDLVDSLRGVSLDILAELHNLFALLTLRSLHLNLFEDLSELWLCGQLQEVVPIDSLMR